ncbi:MULTISPECIES: hypothetical protein [unclassified Bradyrhizobium]|uniref:hypothetical protein n=1 Tax=unclassified Bradyrhizobium TaxID=2631580 RepID=UPI0020B1BD63|nr:MULTISPECIES: hypothetical protein [unclassified Bradyrhizobium]MCP3382093.1 hypothetical protein [Bradyrhizobium sp. CCGUVB4N]MCP3443168.1 hypothetical protein [Bradyrhizobium sp. CCGUVB14]WFU78338.1 hypothetical protein QA645_27840 [Bradyrhizobium sp. CIAT3101]
MRAILALSVLISLCGFANAGSVQQGHRRHAAPHPHHQMQPSGRTSSFAYAPRQRTRSADPCAKPEAYFGACQGYAPGEKEQFLGSVLSPY